ncbi:MAG: hypothetical protein BWY52_02341 [Chloroflexi bacterium ADurb.Bin325]|nr:MAG: hypothetical protein BWY52_02341 [Chloroflexi bacterium ADurb.Bin325]
MRTFAERSAWPGSASVGPARLPSASFVAQRYRAAAAPYAAGHDISRISVFPPAAQPAQAQPAGETHTIEQQYRLSARIRRADTPRSATPGSGARPPWADFDSSEEGEEQPVVTREVGAVMEEESDSVAPTLTYTPSISRGGAAPRASAFGVTRTRPAVANIAIAHDTTASAFNVTATVNNTITWAVQSRGRTDIPNENAAAITSANYATVASDLTPNMSSDNGRPPRTQFWAQDLTERHERFHANERAYTYGQPAFEFAQNWLKSQTATDAAGATALVNQVPDKMHESYATSYAPGKESRAYGDGAPSYRARADAIKAKGDGGGYPAPPAAP